MTCVKINGTVTTSEIEKELVQTQASTSEEESVGGEIILDNIKNTYRLCVPGTFLPFFRHTIVGEGSP